MERKLASVQRVLGVEPIANADAIERVKINGWQCVVKKDEFRVGDLGVYLEIDAIPPDTDTFRFLWTPKPKDGETFGPVERPAKFRIRTLKLRGALSQGLFLPLPEFLHLGQMTEGEDVTERLGVTKYEPPVPVGMGGFRAHFPAFLSKTDEMRVQSVPEVLDDLRGKPYAFTLKVDGTSATYCIDPRTSEFHACGRNFSIVDGPNLYWRIARKYRVEEALRANPGYAIQGEIVGPGVQKNPLGLSELSFFAFNVFDITQARHLGHDEARTFLDSVQIPAVQTVERGDSFAYTLPELLARAEGKYEGTQNEREGLVVRPLTPLFSPTLGGRLSFKAISNTFLLKEKD